MLNQAAVKEMHRQVGDLQINEYGIAVRGLLVRHLVLPHDISGTKEVMRFIFEEISCDSYINIMAQYHPCHEAFRIAQLARPILQEEFLRAIELTHNTGLGRLYKVYPVRCSNSSSSKSNLER